MVRIEDLYETAPIEIEMVGGYFDGRRLHVPDYRDTWDMPVPVTVTLEPDPNPTRPSFDVQRYRWTGSVRDDGTRVFQAT